jgi:transmembrane sensor
MGESHHGDCSSQRETMSAGRDTGEDMAERRRANREASGWVILLQEDPEDHALRSEFDAWLDAKPVHRDAWAETQRISHVVRTMPPAHAHRWRRVKPSILPFLGRNNRRRAAHIFLGAAAACLAITVAPGVLLDLRADAIAGTGEMRSVELADGSKMILAPESAVAFDVSRGGERTVQLLRGRAWFDVAPDPDHPFQVVTDVTTTTVLGTAFEVRKGAGHQVSVAVRNGLVRVACDQPDQTERLTAGEALDLRCAEQSAFRKDVDPARIAAWTDHQIIVSDRPVREVIDALRPWHSGLILTYGTGLDTRRVTGVYDTRQSREVLQALAQSHGLTVRNVTPWVTVITADQGDD